MRPPQSLAVVFVFLLLSASGAVIADGGTVIDHQGERLILDAAEGQHIHGTTPFEAGTVIGVRVQAVGGTHPFLVSNIVRVGENGTFDASFDFSELAPLRGGPVQISVRHNETSVHQTNGTLVTNNMPEDSTFTPVSGTDETMTTTARITTVRATSDSMSGFDVPGFGVETALTALTAVVSVVCAALVARGRW
ncbi:hypothetical protein C440_14214 [Haloferax mucosum ATCC BAA-1512]|uniref:PGF-CTERM sorting domain-containing protein n=1 Tax=Haloferax mucosum ATCC BAA-1512 TaxID=662479 RepID=M0I3W2_9EURY|nr:BGTF surface domain-containing protein [Haloferax mucosum]ELZ91475.1 hypothetical protein C440_14214 [Haloferax mucosum ATCC BAA-1512]